MSVSELSRVLVGLLISATVLLLVQPVRATEWQPPTTVWLAETGHTVDGLFLDTWRAQSDLLGDPISEELSIETSLDGEPGTDRTVQIFENLALVYIPDDPRGAGWEVQTLPLGKETFQSDRERLRSEELAAGGTCAGISASTCRRFGKTGHTVRWGFKEFWEVNDGERLLGMPISEEFVGPDGWTTQYFEQAVLLWKQSSGVSPRAIGREYSAREKIATKKVTQPDGVPIYDEALFQPPIDAVGGDIGLGPGPQQGGYKEIVVSVSQASVWAYEDGALVVSSLVSTGIGEVPETVTPVGYFSVLTKYDVQTMEGTISGEYYLVPDVPYVMYFDNLGNALHGTYWHSNFGAPMSHGCVNLPMDTAAFLYGWAELGTPVTVLA